MGHVTLLSLVTASVAFTLTEATVFAGGVRDWVKELECYGRRQLRPPVGK